MNKKTLILPIAGLAALLFSCSGDSVQSDTAKSPVETKAKLYVTVRDASDGTLVDGAELTMQSVEGQPQVTAAKGVGVFEDIRVGSHRVLATGTNYASAVTNATIGKESADAVYIAQDRAITVALYKLSASLEGVMYHTSGAGKKDVPLDGLPIRVEVIGIGGLLKNTYEAVTKDGGKFSFDKLPAVGTSYRVITTGAVIDGKTYAARLIAEGYNIGNTGGLKKDVNIKLGKVIYDYLDEDVLFVVKKYPSMVEDKQALTFEFTDKIDKNRVTANTVSFGDEVANISWDESSFTLTPVGKWKNDFEVEITGLYSTSNKIFGGLYDITLSRADLSNTPVEEKSLLNLDANTITYYDASAKIIFKKLEGATGYRFYLQEEEEGKTVVKPITCTGGAALGIASYVPSKTDTILSCPVSLSTKNAMGRAMIGSKTNTIIVQAFNSRSENEFEKSAKLEIKESEKSRKTAPDLVWSNGGWGSGIYSVCDPTDGKDNLDPYRNCTGSRAQTFSAPSEAERTVNFYVVDGSSLSLKDFSDFNDDPYDLPTKIGLAVAAPLAEGRIFFTRAMNTSKIPTADISCAKTSAADKSMCDKLDVSFDWLNEQNLSVKISVNKSNFATTAGDVVGAIFKIKNLKGLGPEGEDFASTYQSTTTPTYDALKTLNIKFQLAIPDPCVSDPFNAAGCTGTQEKDYCKVGNRWNTIPECIAFGVCVLFPEECTEFFSEDFENGDFGNLILNTKFGNNEWIYGDLSYADGGDYSAYISDDGSSHSYDNTNASKSTLYQEVHFPSRMRNNYTLSFDWMNNGYPYNDFNGDGAYMTVCLIPTWEVIDCPTYGMYNVGRSYGYSGSMTWQSASISLPHTNYSNEDYYLVFQWTNSGDGSGSNPPAAIDNIVIK